MLDFLITGDLQIHNWKQFSYIRKSGTNSRLYNCLKVFDVLLKEAKKYDINKIIIDGDTFEETSFIDVEVFNKTYRKLEKLCDEGMEVVINLGNHDISRQSKQRILHALEAFGRVARIIERPTYLWGDKVFIIPWDSSPDKLKSTIKHARASKDVCLIGHMGVQGAKTGPTSYLVRNPIKLSDLRKDEFGLVLLADYHTRQRLASNVLYLGSPLQHSFGEIHRPCIWKVSLDREGVFSTKKIFTNFPQFRQLRISSLSEFHSVVSRYSNRDYVRIQLASGTDSEERIRRLAEARGWQVSSRVEEEGVYDADSNKTAYSRTRAFKEYVRKVSTSKHARQRLLELGQKLYKGEI